MFHVKHFSPISRTARTSSADLNRSKAKESNGAGLDGARGFVYDRIRRYFTDPHLLANASCPLPLIGQAVSKACLAGEEGEAEGHQAQQASCHRVWLDFQRNLFTAKWA
jgi:hypothetical protein